MELLSRQKISIRLLILFNAILLSLSWVMMIRAFPRLPENIPYWLPLAGQEILRAPRGPLFFLYPLFQTMFLLAFYLVGTVWIKKPERSGSQAGIGNQIIKARITGKERAISGESGRGDEETAWSDREFIRHGGPGSGGQIIPAEKEGETGRQPGEFSPALEVALTNLKKELVLLLMIFFNLVFIHIQRSLIWLAHGRGTGVNKFYFFSLLVIILLLLPYYRFTRNLIRRGRL